MSSSQGQDCRLMSSCPMALALNTIMHPKWVGHKEGHGERSCIPCLVTRRGGGSRNSQGQREGGPGEGTAPESLSLPVGRAGASIALRAAQTGLGQCPPLPSPCARNTSTEQAAANVLHFCFTHFFFFLAKVTMILDARAPQTLP